MHLVPKISRKRGSYVHDTTRVITRFYLPGEDKRVKKILYRIMNLSEEESAIVLEKLIAGFSDRHRDIIKIFERHFHKLKRFMPLNTKLSEQKKILIGAYFTMEYSVESAALFNPSIVLHPNQTELQKDSIRFIMSFRAIGEGHISSIEFRSGKIDACNQISMDHISKFVETPQIQFNPTYDKHLFQLKLNEMNACNEITTYLFERLPPQFSYKQVCRRR